MKCGIPHCLNVIGTSLRLVSAYGADRHSRCHCSNMCGTGNIADRQDIEYGKVLANKMGNNNKMIVDFGFAGWLNYNEGIDMYTVYIRREKHVFMVKDQYVAELNSK